MDPRLFGTKAYPIRCSSLPSMMECNLMALLKLLAPEEDLSGPAADTGSLTHVAVAEWHRNKDVAKAIAAMRAAQGQFPQGDATEAGGMFLLYASDRRNIEAKLACIEHPVQCTIPPSPEDSTQQEIHLSGTLDQVREDTFGRLYVWDVKTSKRPVNDLLNMYLFQLVGYTLAATKTLGKPVRIGGLIATRAYKKNPSEDPVHVHCPHGLDHLPILTSAIQTEVATIRNGRPTPSPGAHCRYCPQQETSRCVSRLVEICDHTGRIKLPVVGSPSGSK